MSCRREEKNPVVADKAALLSLRGATQLRRGSLAERKRVWCGSLPTKREILTSRASTLLRMTEWAYRPCTLSPTRFFVSLRMTPCCHSEEQRCCDVGVSPAKRVILMSRSMTAPQNDRRAYRPRTSSPTRFCTPLRYVQNDTLLSLRGAAGDVGVSRSGVLFCA